MIASCGTCEQILEPSWEQRRRLRNGLPVYCSARCVARAREIARGRSARHGTHAMYVNQGCRCALCMAAHNAYQRDWYARRRKKERTTP